MFFSGAGNCNIIGWMSKNELLFNLLPYSGSPWSCSIVMFGSNRWCTIHAPDDLFRSQLENNFSLRNLQTRPMSVLLFCCFILNCAIKKITISDTSRHQFYNDSLFIVVWSDLHALELFNFSFIVFFQEIWRKLFREKVLMRVLENNIFKFSNKRDYLFTFSPRVINKF